MGILGWLDQKYGLEGSLGAKSLLQVHADGRCGLLSLLQACWASQAETPSDFPLAWAAVRRAVSQRSTANQI